VPNSRKRYIGDVRDFTTDWGWAFCN